MTSNPPADLDVTADLVRTLLREQCPDLADLPLTGFADGWDNVSFLLGSDLLVRLPRRQQAAALLVHEQQWLPRLAPHLPIEVPVPVFLGRPSGHYRPAWSIVPLLPGRLLSAVPVPERGATAASLANFFIALHLTAPPDAPANPFRGVALAGRAATVRQRLARTPGYGARAVARWQEWSSAPVFGGAPRWLHGDPHPLNLLVDDTGELSGVLDWGDLTAGDPASDLSVAWLAFDEPARVDFIHRCNASGRYDAATWARAKAWALALGSMFVAQGDAALADIGRHAARQLLG